MRRDDHALVDALGELANPRLRCLGSDALLVGARRAAANANRSQSVDIDDDVLLEAGQELAQLRRVVSLHPLFLLVRGLVLEDCSVGIAAHEPRVQPPHELEGLRR